MHKFTLLPSVLLTNCKAEIKLLQNRWNYMKPVKRQAPSFHAQKQQTSKIRSSHSQVFLKTFVLTTFRSSTYEFYKFYSYLQLQLSYLHHLNILTLHRELHATMLIKICVDGDLVIFENRTAIFKKLFDR